MKLFRPVSSAALVGAALVHSSVRMQSLDVYHEGMIYSQSRHHIQSGASVDGQRTSHDVRQQAQVEVSTFS